MTGTWTKIRPTLINAVACLVLLVVGVFLLGYLQSAAPVSDQDLGTITLGWEAHYPYQYESDDANMRRPSGLDTELVRAAFQRAGYDLNMEPRTWSAALAEVESGELDAVSLAFKTPQREKFAYFSRPFFNLRSAVYFRRGRFDELPVDCAALSAKIRAEKLVVGYAKDYAYDPAIAQMLRDVQALSLARSAPSDADNLNALIDGTTDLVIADELGGTSLLMRNNQSRDILCLNLDVPPQEACLMFSKKRVKPKVVEDFDNAMAAMEADGSRARIVRAYYYPTVLNLLAHSFLFNEIAVLAAGAAAISGIFLARKMGTNIVGAFLLAAAPAAGGGLLRDLLAGRHPVAVVADPSIILTVVFLVLVGFLVFRVIDRNSPRMSLALDNLDIDGHPSLIFFDALGLAAFTIFGVFVAMQWHCEPLWLWGPLLAATTNGGGSALRDLILNQPVDLVRSTKPYVEISFLWGWLLSCYLTYSSAHGTFDILDLRMAVGITLVGVCMTYVMVRRSNFQSPVYGLIRRD